MDAFQMIADAYPGLHLIMVGDGPQKETLVRKCLEMPHRARIHLVGFRDDIWLYFKALDVAILGSVKPEGAPQSILQAMAAECPVVGTAVGGIPEVITDRQTGLLVPPADSRLLADAIRTILDNPGLAAFLTSNARTMVEQRYSPDRMGHRVLEVMAESSAPGVGERRKGPGSMSIWRRL
jgi:glycosyltransferase involved in cell wall biosynthesis